MKKKLFACLLSICMALSFAMPATVYADGQKVVTLGADLTQEQQTAILRYFGVLGQNIQTIYVTNQDERNHLGSYVPLEQIGTRTVSCALVNPTTSGGIQVKTANLNWVTSNMIATTLSTSGVVNCEVLAASPFEVSGTGALTGIIMAYETASGTYLDPQRKELATQELITTGNLANSIGQSQATEIVNDIKMQVIEGQVIDRNQIYEIVNDVVGQVLQNQPEQPPYGDIYQGDPNAGTYNADQDYIYLTEDDINMLSDLAAGIAEQGYNYDDMKETLERVNENVSSQETEPFYNADEEVVTAEDPYVVVDEPAAPAAETEEEEIVVLSDDSILMNTDDTALGENVIIDATAQEAIPETDAAPEPEVVEEFPFDITITDDSSQDGSYEDPGIWNIDQPADQYDPYADPNAWNEGTPDQGGVDEVIDLNEQDPYQQPDLPAEVEPEVISLDDGTEEIAVVEDTGSPDAAASGNLLQDVRVTFNEFGTESPADNILCVDIGGVDLVRDYGSVSIGSGTLTIQDEYGTTLATINLTEPGKTKVISAPENTLSLNDWNEGTRLIIQLGNEMQSGNSYTVQIQAQFAETGDSLDETFVAEMDTAGIHLNVSSLDELKTDRTAGVSILTEPGATSAEISYYDDMMAQVDNTYFDLTGGFNSFQITFFQEGHLQMSISYYDETGGYIASKDVAIDVLS